MANKLRTALSISIALGFVAASSQAQSGDSAVAQALFDQAKQMLADGHAAQACPKFEESQRLDPRSGTLINLASCYEQTGRLASAWTNYLAAASSAKAVGNTERETVARERAAALVTRLSHLVINVAPGTKDLPGIEVKLDGVIMREPTWGVALPADSGQHQVTASAPGRAQFQGTVSIAGEGATAVANVPELSAPVGTTPAVAAAVAPVAPPADAESQGLGTQRTVALVAGGVGVVGVGLGAAFGLISKSKHDQAEPSCQDDGCTDDAGLEASNAARTTGTISTVMMIVGGAGLVAGATLWFTAPKPSQGTTQVGLGFGTLLLRRTF